MKIKLHAQPFQVLVLLLANTGEVVTRKEMQERLWGNDTFVDFEHGLNAAVNKIRDALGDAAANPKFVETVPGKGYRFIGAVTVGLAAAKSADEEPVVAGAMVAETPDDLPRMPRAMAKTLLALIQVMYLAFYFGALGNLAEIREIFQDANWLEPGALMAALVVTAAILIPVRLFLLAALGFEFAGLPESFGRCFRCC